MSLASKPERVLNTERVRGQGKAAWESTLAFDLILPLVWPLEVQLRLKATDTDGSILHESRALVSLLSWKGMQTVNMVRAHDFPLTACLKVEADGD